MCVLEVVVKKRTKKSMIKKCPECKSINLMIDDRRGEVICKSCGLVLDEDIVWMSAFSRIFFILITDDSVNPLPEIPICTMQVTNVIQ